MKIRYLALTAFSALVVAAPAAAQYPGYDVHAAGSQIEYNMDQLQERIASSLRGGSISTDEAAGLRAQLWQLRHLKRDYMNGGINGREQDDLQSRLANLWDQLRDARGQGYGYGYGRAWNDRDGNGYDDRLDSDGDGYNDLYDQDRNGYDDRFDHDGDGYDDRSSSRVNPVDPDYYGGMGGGDDPGDEWNGENSVAGGSGIWETNAPRRALRVGDHAPSSLSLVPPDLRSLYPDGNGVVYRYDNGVVYQIDGSGMVRWVGHLPTY